MVAPLPGAGAITLEGTRSERPGPTTGIVICHGFTGTPESVRPWAESLAEAGFTVRVPLLPGHGTRWQELARTPWQHWFATVEAELAGMAARCEAVAVAGLSMGGALALRLAQTHSAVRAVALVNPSLGTTRRGARLLPLVSRLKRTLPGIAGDIARPGVREPAYDRMPLRAAASMARLWRQTVAGLGSIEVPVLAFHSRHDHVVEPYSMRLLDAGLAPGRLTTRTLEHSFHVATLDYDAAAIAAESAAFFAAACRPTEEADAS